MSRKTTPPTIPLPKNWTGHVKSAMLHVIALAQYAITYSRSWASATKASSSPAQSSSPGVGVMGSRRGLGRWANTGVSRLSRGRFARSRGLPGDCARFRCDAKGFVASFSISWNGIMSIGPTPPWAAGHRTRFTFSVFLPTGGRDLNRGLVGREAHRVPGPGPW